MIRWKPHCIEDRAVCGFIGDRQKYYVGPEGPFDCIADVKQKGQMWSWRHINAPVNSIAEGIQLCEMWEATGAYD